MTLLRLSSQLPVLWVGAFAPSSLLVAIAVLGLALGVIIAILRDRSFQLALAAIEQWVMARRFPQGPPVSPWVDELLNQPNRPLIKRALVQTLGRSLRQPIRLEQGLICFELLEQRDPSLAVETVAPILLRLPPLLQLAALRSMTRLGLEVRRREVRGREVQGRAVRGREVRGRAIRRRDRLAGPSLSYNPQRHLCSVTSLMTPIASPAVFAAALRYCLYLGPLPQPRAILLHLQPEQDAAVRAVAAVFALNQVAGAGQAAADPGSPAIAGKGETCDRLTRLLWADLIPRAKAVLQAMLTHETQEERLAASEALLDALDLTPFKRQIPALLEDFSPQVREAALAAIAQSRCQALYPYLLKALRSPLTQQPAQAALLAMGDDAIPLLQRCTRHREISVETKLHCWRTLAQIAARTGSSSGPRIGIQSFSPLAYQALVEDVLHQQGTARQRLLSLLLAQPQGAELLAHNLSQSLAGAEGVMQLVREELWLLSHLYAALVDLHPRDLPGIAARQLRQALNRQQREVGERILLLLQIRYPEVHWDRVVQQLRSPATLAQGLKRLSQILAAPLKEPILAVFNGRPAQEKRLAFSGWEACDRRSCPDRLQQLLTLGPSLDPDAIACAYGLALEQAVPLDDELLLRGVNHGDPAVRVAAQAYLNQMPEAVVAALLG